MVRAKLSRDLRNNSLQVKNLAGLPGMGHSVQTWRARVSHSVNYAPKNISLWTPGYLAEHKRVKVPLMPPVPPANADDQAEDDQAQGGEAPGGEAPGGEAPGGEAEGVTVA